MFDDRDSQKDIKTSIMDFQAPGSERSIRLIVLSGHDRGREIVAAGPFISVGRSPECSFVLKDQTVSRRHFGVAEADGAWIIEDAGSGNGTSVNGVRITRERLKNGDRISAGNTVIKVDNIDLWTRAEVSAGRNEPLAIDRDLPTRRDVDELAEDIQEIRLGTPGPIGRRFDEVRESRVHPLVFPGVVILLLLLFLGTYYARSCSYLKDEEVSRGSAQPEQEPREADTTIRIPLPMEVTPPAVLDRPAVKAHGGERQVVLTPEQTFQKMFDAGKFADAAAVTGIDRGIAELAGHCDSVFNRAALQMGAGRSAAVNRDLAELAAQIEQAGLKVPQSINSLRADCMALLGKTAAADGRDAAAADMARRALALDSKCDAARTLQNDVSNRAAMYFNRAVDALRRGQDRQAALDFTTVTRILPQDHRLYQAAIARMP